MPFNSFQGMYNPFGGGYSPYGGGISSLNNPFSSGSFSPYGGGMSSPYSAWGGGSFNPYGGGGGMYSPWRSGSFSPYGSGMFSSWGGGGGRFPQPTLSPWGAAPARSQFSAPQPSPPSVFSPTHTYESDTALANSGLVSSAVMGAQQRLREYENNPSYYDDMAAKTPSMSSTPTVSQIQNSPPRMLPGGTSPYQLNPQLGFGGLLNLFQSLFGGGGFSPFSTMYRPYNPTFQGNSSGDGGAYTLNEPSGAQSHTPAPSGSTTPSTTDTTSSPVDTTSGTYRFFGY